MLTFARKKIASTKTFILMLFLYSLSLNIFPVFSHNNPAYASLLSLWNISCLAMLICYVLWRYRLKFSSTANVPLALLFTVAIIGTILVAIQGSNISIYHDLPDLIVPLIYMYLFLVILAGKAISPKGFMRLSSYIVSFGVFTALYNMFINRQALRSFSSISDPYELNLSSYFLNRNTFGLVMALSLILVIYLHSKKAFKNKRVIMLTAILILLINLIVSMSRGAIVLTIVFAGLYLLFHYRFKGLLFIVSMMGSLYLILNRLLGSEFITNNLIRADVGSTGRGTLQSFGWNYFKTHHLLFGGGFQEPITALQQVTGFTSYHNAYITILVRGGLMLALAYLVLIVYLVRKYRSIRSYDRLQGNFFISFLVAFGIYNLVETNIPLQFDGTSIVVSVLIIFMPCYLLNHYKNNHLISNAATGKNDTAGVPS